jgi:TM2 domain-containing membrane protein YozV
MKIHLKAALLSAFILPGLGQLYKGEKVKGVIIIVLVNIFLLLALILVLREMAPLILSAQVSGEYDAGKVLEHLQTAGPTARLLLAAFSGLWLYGLIDAALGKKGKE